VITTAATNAASVLALLGWRGIQARRIGTVGGNDLIIKADGAELHWSVSQLHDAWYHSIRRAMEGEEHVLIAAAE
jgi:hypothetical protein